MTPKKQMLHAIVSPKGAERLKDTVLPPDEVKCTKCNWTGWESDLVICWEGEYPFKGCPNCKTDDFLMDND